MLYVTKSAAARKPSLRVAALKAKPPAAPKAAKLDPKAAQAFRTKLRASIDEALEITPAKASTKPASRPAKRATKLGTPAKAAVPAKKRSAAATKTPVPLPAPRGAPAPVKIGFPKLPAQTSAARYQAPAEQKRSLARFQRFLSVARMVGDARKLTADERHQVEVARARVAELKQLGGL